VPDVPATTHLDEPIRATGAGPVRTERCGDGSEHLAGRGRGGLVEPTASSPEEVRARLERHLLVDGYDLVLDLEASVGSQLDRRA
jgi:hypothetical protein